MIGYCLGNQIVNPRNTIIITSRQTADFGKLLSKEKKKNDLKSATTCLLV